MRSKLKAYQVTSGDDIEIVFDTNSASARRRGAENMWLEWEDIDSCHRIQKYDWYAPGPVPPLRLIEDGWIFECQYCGRQVHSDMDEDLEDEGLDPSQFIPVHYKYYVFCSKACDAQDTRDRQLKEEAAADLIEVFTTYFPGATVDSVHLYDHRLRKPDTPSYGIKYAVYFTFPGGKFKATWQFGDENVSVATGDLEAFVKYRKEYNIGGVSWVV